MPVKRFRDVGEVTFDGTTTIECVNSVTIALGSDVLRGRCGSAVSERYQGLTNLNVEITVESADPFVDIHPGDRGSMIFFIPGTPSDTGLPGDGLSLIILDAVVTTHSGRIEKDALATGTYVFRGVSLDGVSTPLEITEDEPIADHLDSSTASSFIRDISDFEFDPTGDGAEGGLDSDDFCPRSFEFSENSELIEDSCQGEIWPTYVGISGLNLTATVTGRGIVPALEDLGGPTGTGGDLGLGKKGTITFSALVGSDENCADLESGGTVTLSNMNVNEVTITATHGEIAEASVSWTGHGVAGDETDETKRAIAVFGAGAG